MKNAKEFFEQHDADVLYFTSDSLAFFDVQHAQKHARQLEDKTISTLTRDEVNGAVDASMSAAQWAAQMQELLDEMGEAEELLH